MNLGDETYEKKVKPKPVVASVWAFFYLTHITVFLLETVGGRKGGTNRQTQIVCKDWKQVNIWRG